MKNWKQFRNTNYSVSDTGDVRNDTKNIVLKLNQTRQGYKRITIWHERSSFTMAVHRMVIEAFQGVCEFDNGVVNHIDGNPSNNALSNLEWVTISENVKHAYATGLAKRGERSVNAILTETQVVEIKIALANNTIRAIAKKYGVSDATVSHIRNGETWSHVLPELNVALADKEKYHKYKISAKDIPEIRRSFYEGRDDNEIAAVYGVHRATIYNIRSGKNWKNY